MAIEEITVHELRTLLQRGVVVFDVRENDEYLSGHVPGAVSVPLSVLSDKSDLFPDDRTNYLICQAGGRSLRACEFLASLGKSVVNVAGGTGAWLSSGFEVVYGDSSS